MPPLLFVFTNTFDYYFEYSFEDNAELYYEALEKDWFEYWQTEGDKIVNSSWQEKYSEYLASDKPEPIDNTESHLVESTSFQIETTENTLSELNLEDSTADSYNEHWQELWEEHYSKTYQKTFEIYSIVHYSHYNFYRESTEENFDDLPLQPLEDEFEFLDEKNQLEALGLPTSFGGSNNKYHNSRLQESSSNESLNSDQEEDMAPTPKQLNQQTKKKKKKNRKIKLMPEFIKKDKSLQTYWFKRFSLFSRFDEGIQLDRESWFSVTPEKVAIHMAERLKCDTIIDAFCGSGGNAIQFAQTCSKVIAIDIDPEKIRKARHNAKIYGVANQIEFIIGDFLHLCESLKGDVVFLSPPWGGPKYMSQKVYDIEESLAPLSATALAEKSRRISENIAIFLPRNSNPHQIAKLAGIGNRVEVEQNYLDKRFVGLTAIYGDWLIDKNNLSDK